MAGGRIKGITIELNGDSTKLEASLKSVNSEIRNTESKLKDVNKLLKIHATYQTAAGDQYEAETLVNVQAMTVPIDVIGQIVGEDLGLVFNDDLPSDFWDDFYPQDVPYIPADGDYYLSTDTYSSIVDYLCGKGAFTDYRTDEGRGVTSPPSRKRREKHMASNKTYTVVKDGENLKELKTLAAAKKLADAEDAEVLCDGKCVYLGAESGVGDTVDEVSDTVEETAPKIPAPVPEKYTLTAKMNIRRAPSLNAEKAGIAQKGTVVEVAAVKGDWLHLTDGTFILCEGGRFAVKN